MYWRRSVTRVAVAIASAAALSKVAISNGHCIAQFKQSQTTTLLLYNLNILGTVHELILSALFFAPPLQPSSCKEQVCLYRVCFDVHQGDPPSPRPLCKRNLWILAPSSMKSQLIQRKVSSNLLRLEKKCIISHFYLFCQTTAPLVIPQYNPFILFFYF